MILQALFLTLRLALIVSAILTSAEIFSAISFTPPEIAMCEWQSITPGTTKRPRASIRATSGPVIAKAGDLAAHLPDLVALVR